LDFYSASSLKQQSVDRHVALRGHIILIPAQAVFVISPLNYALIKTNGLSKYEKRDQTVMVNNSTNINNTNNHTSSV
jgi:hypothetical protein